MDNKDEDAYRCECAGFKQTEKTKKCEGCDLFYCAHCLYVKEGEASCFACLKHDPMPDITLDSRGCETPPTGCGSNYFDSWSRSKENDEDKLTLRLWV